MDYSVKLAKEFSLKEEYAKLVAERIISEAEDDEVEYRANQYREDCQFRPWHIALNPCIAPNKP